MIDLIQSQEFSLEAAGKASGGFLVSKCSI
jgi:hypothetical protein